MDINETFRSLNVGLPEDILRRKFYGDFEGAIRLIDRRLMRADIPQDLHNCMTVQREMMLRTPPDYPFTKEQAMACIRSHIIDFTEEEFDERVEAGKIGWIYLNGEPHYFARFFETMCKADHQFANRAGVQMYGVESVAGSTDREDRLERCTHLMKERGQIANRIRIRATIRLSDDRFTPGMFLRAHLPIPAACEQQDEIMVEEMTPSNGKVDPEDALQRTICWAGEWEDNPEFSVTYSYLHTARYHDLTRPGMAAALDPKELAPCLREEAPHIMFTPYLRSLAAQLTQDKETPLEKARSIYDFITLNMQYTFMPAYFGLENIAENCARNFTGDCGVFALLFITLCRCAGVPARWQSGLAAEPDFCGGHDWAMFYVPTYGWLYADPSYGTAAVRAGKEERRKFYFGNLDAYRMVANRQFQAPFVMEKAHWRADPYDNQVGELETADYGLTYGEFERTKTVLLCEEL